MAIPDAERQFDQMLDEFVVLCDRLTNKGLPYLSVILSHELLRFLYPVEPYANFVNSDPVPFGLQHIGKLISLGRAWSETVAPYDKVLESFNGARWHGAWLEMTTSNLYSELWKDFDDQTRAEESTELLRRRVPERIISEFIAGKRSLDMGCGSGRYTIALASVGAQPAVGVDVQAKAFSASAQWARDKQLSIEFHESNVHELPFPDESFGFVFCNGVLHHTSSVERGLSELARVLKKSGASFIYLYGAGGYFWKTRERLREVFKSIPLDYTKYILSSIGMPSNRFIFCDTWYVPIEDHIPTEDLHRMFDTAGLTHEKIVGQAPFDLDRAIAEKIPGAATAWGNGEHRYLLKKR